MWYQMSQLTSRLRTCFVQLHRYPSCRIRFFCKLASDHWTLVANVRWCCPWCTPTRYSTELPPVSGTSSSCWTLRSDHLIPGAFDEPFCRFCQEGSEKKAIIKYYAYSYRKERGWKCCLVFNMNVEMEQSLLFEVLPGYHPWFLFWGRPWCRAYPRCRAGGRNERLVSSVRCSRG